MVLQGLSKRMLFLKMLKILDKLHILFYYFMQNFAELIKFEIHKFEFLQYLRRRQNYIFFFFFNILKIQVHEGRHVISSAKFYMK